MGNNSIKNTKKTIFIVFGMITVSLLGMLFCWMRLVHSISIQDELQPDGNRIITIATLYGYNREAGWLLLLFILLSVGVLVLSIIIIILRMRYVCILQKESGAKYRAITNAIPDAVITVDDQGIITLWNQAAERIFGYNKQEAEGRKLSQLIIPVKYRQSFMRAMQGFKKTGKGAVVGRVVELTGVNKEGKHFPVEIYVATVRLNDRWYAVSMIRNISMRKKGEAERKSLQEQIRRAQKMEAIGTLAGGIAHNFNNVLVAIFGFTDLALLETSKGSSVWQNLTQVKAAGNRAKKLVTQILAFSRQSESSRQPLDVAPVIRETLKMLRTTLPSSVNIKQNIGAGSFTIMAEPAQFHRVLMKLCLNAVAAMSDQNGILEVDLGTIEIKADDMDKYDNIAAGRYLNLTISDTGRGMDQATIDRVFEPFFTTREKTVGTGMGLAVVHGIVQSYQGCITITSELGQGSIFSVLIPLLTEDDIDQQAAAMAVNLPPKGDGLVLLVDDEEALVTLGQKMLEYLGYEVVVSTSSVEALKMFRAEPDKFDMVITDQTMPDLTGGELAAKILEMRDIPIILCTDFSEVMPESKTRDIGVKGHLVKPLSINDLALACQQALRS